MGGLMQHIKAITAVANQTVNSYKRLVPGYEAPVYIAWSCRNRSPLIRVPAKRGMSTRLELRSPDPSCNPYLTLAVCLQAGLWGIEHGIEPPPPCDQNIYEMDEAERREQGIDTLPANLYDAVAELERDPVIRDALGEHVFERFITAKKIEWDRYRTTVHDWEITEYLTKF
jgi:glutamine synthetase